LVRLQNAFFKLVLSHLESPPSNLWPGTAQKKTDDEKAERHGFFPE
jgi:hypothetical protein